MKSACGITSSLAEHRFGASGFYSGTSIRYTSPQRRHQREDLMTRIAILKREELNADQGRVYDEAKAANQPVGGPYYAYIRNPRLFTAAQEMGKAIGSFKLSGRERQIAVLTVCRFWNAKYPWGAQSRNSLSQGVDQATIDAINAGKTPDLPSPREAMAH